MARAYRAGVTTPVPGWYPDPQSPAQLRWWDGTRWTEHARPLPATGPAGGATPAQAQGGHAPSAPQYGQSATGQYGQTGTGQYGQTAAGQYGQSGTEQYGRSQGAQSTEPSQEQATAVFPQAPRFEPALGAPAQSAHPDQYPGIDTSSTKPFFRRTWVLVSAGVFAFIVVVGVAAGLSGGSDEAAPRPDGAPTTAVDSTTTELVEVPDVVGMSLADATAAIEAAGLTVGTIGDAGDVESQAPSGGQSVDPDSQVMLTVVDRAAQEAAAAAAQAEADAAAAAAEAAKGTVSQQNAYQAAQSYLSFTSFSRAGLIDQLTSEYGDGYPPEDAEFAVARLEAEGGVDWNAEAAEAAASYLSFTSFSRQGLLDQLTSEYGDGFTPEQAEYGVSTTGL